MRFQVDNYYTQTWIWNLLFIGTEPRIVHHKDAMLSEARVRQHFSYLHYSFSLMYKFVYGIAALRIVFREYINLRRLIRALSYYEEVRLRAN